MSLCPTFEVLKGILVSGWKQETQRKDSALKIQISKLLRASGEEESKKSEWRGERAAGQLRGETQTFLPPKRIQEVRDETGEK